MGEMVEFGDLGRMEQHRAASRRIFLDQRIDLMLGADVDAARGIKQQQDSALREQPFGDRDLLLIAARKGLHRRP